ncbi:uracil-DNA glycosylase [Saccharibacillus sp. CPCC 101409]|uniref:uracil-DNA glycosylase n=1 Tax=Saccharibacillus sp. CPCC 101409 TaxID=3058041 RepID=UPI0026720A3F|nr:uracil-DNA glycosylase [Saccharibacillus sp. CPCC 101409]MDO3409296.1 uracil-DNA glycosylase [Saccharibacillus sp. CPCC 101409]
MFGNDWDEVLKDEIRQPYFEELMRRVEEEYETHTVYPPKPLLFQALKLTPFANVKAVILGQDPYHGPGQAHGLSFSVLPGVRIPPSLRNMYKEMASDLNVPAPDHGYLIHWAEEGVLLLNTVLTVREGQAASHQKLGWQRFTDAVIQAIGEREQPAVFILWGSHAQKKEALIDASRHAVLKSVHPSPLSARGGFFGSRPYSQTNDYLKSHGIQPINWEIPSL